MFMVINIINIKYHIHLLKKNMINGVTMVIIIEWVWHISLQPIFHMIVHESLVTSGPPAHQVGSRHVYTHTQVKNGRRIQIGTSIRIEYPKIYMSWMWHEYFIVSNHKPVVLLLYLAQLVIIQF